MENYTKKIPIEELEEYGYVMIRKQPCKIMQILKIQNDAKHGSGGGKAKLRWDLVVNNLFSGEEVWKGIVKDAQMEVPIVEITTYDLNYASNTDSECTLMDEECEEIDGVELPVDDNPGLVKDIRNAFNDDQDITVDVCEAFGRKVIIAYEVE
jgi:translation elongation factor P/translation initiation factor 5A